MYRKIIEFAVAGAVWLFLQPAPAAAQSFSFAHLNSSQGLSQNSVFSIVQDKEGFMWFGTQAGLDRYDGARFRHFVSHEDDSQTLYPGYVTALFDDPSTDLLWAGTEQGLCFLDRKDNYRVRRLPLADAGGVVSLWGDRRGTVWALTPRALYQVRTANGGTPALRSLWRRTSEAAAVKGFCVLPENAVGLLAFEDGIQVLDLAKKRPSYALLRAADLGPARIAKLYGTPKRLVVGWETGGASVFALAQDPTGLVSVVRKSNLAFPVRGGQHYQNCTSVFEDTARRLWIGTERHGLFVYDSTLALIKHILRNFNSEQSLSSSYILSGYSGADGTLWVGTNGGGVSKLLADGAQFLSLFAGYKDAGFIPNNDVWSIYQVQHTTVVVGTDGNGLLTFTPYGKKKGRFYNLRDTMANVVRCLAFRSDSLWIGTDSGLYAVPFPQLETFRRARRILPGSVTVLYNADGALWIGTAEKGLYRLDESSAYPRKLLDAGQTGSVAAIGKAEGSDCWIGSVKGVFGVHAGPANATVKQHFLSGKPVACCLACGDTLWVGTRGEGLYALDTRSGKPLQHFTTENGLLDNVIYGLLSDRAGRLWFSSNKGLSAYNLALQSFNHYTRKYGLQHDEFNTGAFHFNEALNSQWMFFGGVNGLNAFRPAAFKRTKAPASACLLTYSKEAGPDNARIHRFGDELRINPMDSYTLLEVKVFAYADPDNNRYQWRFDSGEWSPEYPAAEPIALSRERLKNHRHSRLGIRVRSSDGEWQSLEPVQVRMPFNFFSELRYASPAQQAVGVILGILAFILGIIAVVLFRNARGKSKKLLANNEQLENERNRYQDLNARLQAYNHELEELQSLINAINHQHGLDAVLTTALVQLTTEKLFRFDRAAFWQVNYRNFEIHLLGESRATAALHPVIYLDSDHPCVYALRRNEIIESAQERDDVNGRSVYCRLFVPVALVSDTGPDLPSPVANVIAVLEIGVLQEQWEASRSSQAGRLKLYADNLAQAYQAATREEQNLLARNILKRAEQASGDDPYLFLKKVLTEVCQSFRLAYGLVALRSWNRDAVAREDPTVGYGDEDLAPFLQAVLYKGELPTRGKPAEPRMESKPEFLVSSTEDGQKLVLLSVPFLRGGDVIGKAGFVSRGTMLDEEATFIEKLFTEIGEEYANKRFHNAIGNLVKPEAETVPTDPAETMGSYLQILRSFFLTDHVSFWLRDPAKTDPVYYQVTGANLGETESFAGETHTIKQEIPALEPLALNGKTPTAISGPFWKYVQKKQLVAFVHVPLKIEVHTYGFINLYAKRPLRRELFLEQKQFLQILADKAIISFITSKIVTNFSTISQSMVDNELPTVLLRIARSAREILFADVVILYQYEAGKGILYAKTIHDGKLQDEKKITEGKGSAFLEALLEEGKDSFIGSEEELLTLHPQQREANRFWHREKIRSMASVILKQGDETIGVMFYNYRQDKTYPETVRRLTKAFSNLATIAIVNARNFSQLKEQREQLRERAETMQQRSEALKTQADHLETKIVKMLPTANAALLADIVRAVNHDISNSLVKVQQSLFTIKSKDLQYIRSAGDREQLLRRIDTIGKDIVNTKGLIELFEPGSFRVSRVNVNGVIDKVINMFKEEPGINVFFADRDAALDDVNCSKAEMSMIVYNLVFNGRRAIVERWIKQGRKTQAAEGELRVETRYNEAAGDFQIKISDDGIGMDNAVQEQIFKLGFTTQANGLGIGLFFVRQTLEKFYEGTVTCASYYNKGTTFFLKFKHRKD